MTASTDRYAYELANCSVRIEGRVNGESMLLGTGFFIGQGLICTCGHVVKDASHIIVTWRRARYSASKVTAFPGDIATLKIGTNKNPMVAIGDDIGVYDRALFYGFTSDYPGGVGATAEFEFVARVSDDEDAVYLKFSQGQFSPGFSGAAILNVATGTVCGMVNRSRDIHSERGGYAIPISTLERYVPKIRTLRDRKRSAIFTGSRRRDHIKDVVRRLEMRVDNIMYDLIYVAMPLESAAALERYAVIVEEAARSGFLAMHATEHPTLAMHPLIVRERLIMRCNLAIFDLTDEHPDVYYQLGLQAAVEPEPDGVLLMRHAANAELRFGVVPFAVETFNDSGGLRRIVRAAIDDLPVPKTKVVARRQRKQQSDRKPAGARRR